MGEEIKIVVLMHPAFVSAFGAVLGWLFVRAVVRMFK